VDIKKQLVDGLQKIVRRQKTRLVMVTKEIEYAANEAVYGLQLEHKQAINFIVRNAKTDPTTARQALNETLTSYKQCLGGE
jgi:hypothetical protein